MNRQKSDDFQEASIQRHRQFKLNEWYPFAGLVLIAEYFLLGLLGG